MSLIVLLQARNEERYLPGWLANIGDSVDGIVALDDGSTDRTPELLRAHPELLSLLHNPPGGSWDERDNHIRLIEEGRRHGATWFFPLDADEKVEPAFGSRVRSLMNVGDEVHAYLFRYRELWGSRNHYRSDGIWKRKLRFRLFRNVPDHSRWDPRPYHRTWLPLEIEEQLGKVGRSSDLDIYHLKMIEPAARAARVALYKSLDPDSTLQPIGYRYLTDETGIRVRRIAKSKWFTPLADPAAPEAPLRERARSWLWRRRIGVRHLLRL